jgi:hypothetical protein
MSVDVLGAISVTAGIALVVYVIVAANWIAALDGAAWIPMWYFLNLYLHGVVAVLGAVLTLGLMRRPRTAVPEAEAANA